jgi:hypothetical protein
MKCSLTDIEEPADETAAGIVTLVTNPARHGRRQVWRSPLTGTRDRGDQFDALIRDVQQMSQLKPNWDLYGGNPPGKECINFAIQILKYAMYSQDCPIPTVKPIPSGVFVDWHRGTTRLYFEADQDSVLAVSEDGESIVDHEFAHRELETAYALIYNFTYGLNNAECVY